MNKVAFIGSYDKADLMLYVAKVLTILGKKVILVDATALQKTRYIIPKMTPAKKYITTFENIDVAIGFESFGEIKKYKELEDTAKLDYDYALVNIDSYRGYYNFKIQTEDKRFFVTSFDVYCLRRGLQVFKRMDSPALTQRILFSKDMEPAEVEYLNYLSKNLNVKWVEDKMDDIKKISAKISDNEAISIKEDTSKEKIGALAKMKAFVRKAVDCCIE